MLLETGDANGCLLNFFGDSASMLEDSIKNIMPFMSSNPNLSAPLTWALTTVNKFRIKNGTDRFGMGKCPWVLEPVNIVVFTSGEVYDDKVIAVMIVTRCLLCSPRTIFVHKGLTLTKTPGTGGDLISEEPYRWDQRIFACVVREEENFQQVMDEPFLSNLGALVAVSFSKMGYLSYFCVGPVTLLDLAALKHELSILLFFYDQIHLLSSPRTLKYWFCCFCRLPVGKCYSVEG